VTQSVRVELLRVLSGGAIADGTASQWTVVFVKGGKTVNVLGWFIRTWLFKSEG
jgi:hypothetical protein